MSKTRFSGLAGVMRGQSDTMPRAVARGPQNAPESEPDDEPEELEGEEEEAGDCQKKDKMMKNTPESEADNSAESNASATADAVAKARAEERKRVADVFASEDVKGREMAAAELLANSSMEAPAIVAMLPKLTPAANADDGKEMLQQMREGADVDLGNRSENVEAAAEENHGWGNAIAKAKKLSGRA